MFGCFEGVIHSFLREPFCAGRFFRQTVFHAWWILPPGTHDRQVSEMTGRIGRSFVMKVTEERAARRA